MCHVSEHVGILAGIMATARATTSSNTDERVDSRIAAASPSLQPILEYLRDLVHQAVPDATETIKWGHPFFQLDGVLLANMGIFRQHCAFGFWSRTMTEHLKADGIEPLEGAGSFGRIVSLSDLPPRRKMLAYLRTAAAHIRQGVAESPMRARAAAKRRPDGAASSKPAIPIPAALRQLSPAHPKRSRPLTPFRPVAAASTWPGSPGRSATRPAPAAFSRRSRRCRKASASTGSTRQSREPESKSRAAPEVCPALSLAATAALHIEVRLFCLVHAVAA